MSEVYSYDRVPYPTNDFPQTGPDRLATIATIFGLTPADPQHCRVMELGSGTGANLISFAYTLPESEFVGVDLSIVQTEEAKRAATKIGLNNAAFHHGNIMDPAFEELGEFDYIIAHGLYSWVPEVVRERILEIYAKCLSPSGIGYISYNALPGWHTRSIIRELMIYHTSSIEDPLTRVDEAVKIVGFMTDTAKPGTRYHDILKYERDSIANRARQSLLHDVMETDNNPFYLHQFIEQIGRHGLQYIAEAEPIDLFEDDLEPDVLKVLNEIGQDPIRRQQYVDFVRACRFRCSLICRDGLKVERTLDPRIVEKLFIAGFIEAETDEIEITDASPAKFCGPGPRNAKFGTNHPLSKAALVFLNKQWPKSVSFKELSGYLREVFKTMDESEFEVEILQLKGFLLHLFKAEIIRFHSFQPKLSCAVNQYPKVSEYVRWQVSNESKTVTTPAGVNMEIEDEMVRAMLVLLDGSRDRETLLRDLTDAAEGSDAAKDDLRAALSSQIDAKLSSIAKAGMFVK